MRIHRVGASALLIEVERPLDWHAALLRRRAAGELSAVDLVPGARTVLIDGIADPAALAAVLPGWAPSGGPAAAELPVIEIPVSYAEGRDLAFVADLWAVHRHAAVERLASTDFTVAFCGFSPGFGYLTGLPAALAVPRLATPRPRVPAGSLALAGTYAGIYPTESPGGWRLVGHTDLCLFDVDRDPPALLSPGRRVRLVPV